MKSNPKDIKGNVNEIHVNNSEQGKFMGGGDWIVRD